MTATWADQPAYPQRDREEKPKISYLVNTQNNIRDYQSYFDFDAQSWGRQIPTFLKDIVVYVRVDGSFSVFDPARRSDSA